MLRICCKITFEILNGAHLLQALLVKYHHLMMSRIVAYQHSFTKQHCLLINAMVYYKYVIEIALADIPQICSPLAMLDIMCYHLVVIHGIK